MVVGELEPEPFLDPGELDVGQSRRDRAAPGGGQTACRLLPEPFPLAGHPGTVAARGPVRGRELPEWRA